MPLHYSATRFFTRACAWGNVSAELLGRTLQLIRVDLGHEDTKSRNDPWRRARVQRHPVRRAARDKALAETVSSYWVNFARKGDPNGDGLAAWPAFRDRNTSQPMILGDSQERPDPAKLALYDALYANLMAVN